MAESDTDELQLFRRIRKGDERAFAVLYERHQGRIFRFVLHMTGNQSIAEEVTQEAFMLLIRKPTTYNPDKGPLSAYLFGIARNLAHRATRNNSFQVSFPDSDEFDQPTSSDSDIVQLLSTSEDLDSLRKALLALPEPYREAIVLCDLQEMSYEQAAGIMQCSVGTVASRLHRAHTMLKTRLSHIAASNREKRNSHA